MSAIRGERRCREGCIKVTKREIWIRCDRAIEMLSSSHGLLDVQVMNSSQELVTSSGGCCTYRNCHRGWRTDDPRGADASGGACSCRYRDDQSGAERSNDPHSSLHQVG